VAVDPVLRVEPDVRGLARLDLLRDEPRLHLEIGRQRVARARR
jgi:hypothetical protein